MIRDEAYLRHILDAIAKIEAYVASGRDAFMSQSLIQDAVIREFEIIGEATKRLSESMRGTHPEIPWRRIAGLRDVLIHDYMGVDLAAVWEMTQKNLPGLKDCVGRMLAKASAASADGRLP